MEVTGLGITTDTGFAVKKLESDLIVEGDAKGIELTDWNAHNVIINGDFLNTRSNKIGDGCKLEVRGNIVVENQLTIGSGRLEVGGDLRVQAITENGEYTSTVNGRIVMADENGYVLVEGDAYFDHWRAGASSLSSGTIELKGNLTDVHTDSWNNSYGWSSTESFKWKFSGDEFQNISIPSQYNDGGWIATMEVTGLGITTDTGFAVKKLESDLNIEGDAKGIELTDWNTHTIYIHNTSIVPNVTLPTDYGRKLSLNIENNSNYDIVYAPVETSYKVKYYVLLPGYSGYSLKNTKNGYMDGSLVEPYNISLSDTQEFEGWYSDDARTKDFNILTDTISEDTNLYGRVVQHVTGISLSNTSIMANEVGETYTLRASIIPSNATFKNVTWTSSDESVATVSSFGKITAVGLGSADITAEADGKSEVCKITVSKKDISECDITIDDEVGYTGEDVSISPIIKSSIKILEEGVDYEIVYPSERKNLGTEMDIAIKGINHYKGSITANVTISEGVPIVHPVIEDVVLFEGDDFPQIQLTEGDTPGTIFFTEGQTLQSGTRLYYWTYIPDDSGFREIGGSYSLTVKDLLITAVSIEKQPNKTMYKEGELFDAVGIELKVSYNNGRTKKVSDCTVLNQEKTLELSDNIVTIYFVEKGKMYTVDVPVQVFKELSEDVSLTSLSVKGVYGSISENSIEVILPMGENVFDIDENDISIVTGNAYATVYNLTFLDEDTSKWYFNVRAQDNITENAYVLSVKVAETETQYMEKLIETAQNALGRYDFDKTVEKVVETVKESSANISQKQELIKVELVDVINNIDEVAQAGLAVESNDIVINDYVEAVDGNADNPIGTDGTYSISIQLHTVSGLIDLGTYCGSMEAEHFDGETNEEYIRRAEAVINSLPLGLNSDLATKKESAVAEIAKSINECLFKNNIPVQVNENDIVVNSYSAAIDGNVNDPFGANGEFSFCVRLRKGSHSITTAQRSILIHPKQLEIYYIYTNVNGNGTIESDYKGYVLSGGKISFSIIPYDGYCIKQLLINGISVDVGNGEQMNYTISNITCDETLDVLFEKIPDKESNSSNNELQQINEFVSRMYTVVLNREAETGGLSYWTEQLTSQEMDGAGISNGFINSPEFKARNLSDSDYLDVLYRTFFDREADADGKNYWMERLSSGDSRTEVLSEFVNSKEFSQICDRFGIARGTMQPNGGSIYRPGVRNYVLRMYTKALGRSGETLGVEYWSNEINMGFTSAETVAKSFFMSEEFQNRKLSNADYVETLYQTFMDRASDAEGKEYWINNLNSGMNREQALEGFARSKEFRSIMQSYGL